MRLTSCLAGALLGAASACLSAPVRAQVTTGADAALFSDYVWRGLSLTNNFVIEPDAYLVVTTGPGAVTAGVWGNIEPSQYDGPNDISEGGGQASPDLTEYDLWLEYNQTVKRVTFTLGGVGYWYPNRDNASPPAPGLLTNDVNRTVELYGKVGLSNLLNPKLAVWYDVDKVNGAYFEGSISHSFPASSRVSVTLGALTGLSAGQGRPDSPTSDDLFNFSDDGFTHVDLSASAGITAGPVTVAPTFHLIIPIDDFTKINSPSELDEDVKVWFGGTISWSRAFGGSGGETE